MSSTPRPLVSAPAGTNSTATPELFLAPDITSLHADLFSPQLLGWHRLTESARYALHIVCTGTAHDVEAHAAIVSHLFSDLVGHRQGHVILKELVRGQVLESDGHYTVGQKARRYRLTDRARALGLTLSEAPAWLATRVRALREEKTNEAIGKSERARMIYADLPKFTLSPEAPEVLERLCREKPEAAAHHRLVAHQLWNRQLYIVESRHGRIFHPIASLSKQLRACLQVGGRSCDEIDMGACIPSLTVSVYRGPGAERARYVAVIQGDFYLYLQRAVERMTGKQLTREEAKHQYLVETFGPSRMRGDVSAAMLADFPELFSLLDEIKARNYRALAHRMQRQEADFMLGGVLPRVRARLGDVPIATVHDSLICPEGSSEVAAIMREVFQESFGFEPLVKVTPDW